MRQAVIRVALADSEPAFRAGVRQALDPVRFAVVAEAANVESLLQETYANPPDLVLVDETLVEEGGGSFPFPRFVVLVRRPSLGRLLELLQLGASGCIARDVTAARLQILVEDAAAGGIVVPPALVGPALAQTAPVPTTAGNALRLTRRQAQILSLIEDGLRDEEIARLLRVSPVTVRRHLSDVTARTGESVRSRAPRPEPRRAA